MLIFCEIPNKHILSSFSHLTLYLRNKSANIAVKRAASPFPDTEQNQMFVFIFVLWLMVKAYTLCVWHGILPRFSSLFKVIFLPLLWRALKNLAASLSPGISSRQTSHKAVFSWSAKHIPNKQNCFFFHSLFHDVPNAPVFSIFITDLEGLHGSEALNRFLNIHWRTVCATMALKTKQVQMQSGAKQGLQCDGRHTAAHMLFKMVYYSSAV